MPTMRGRERAHERWMQRKEPTPYRIHKCPICQHAKTCECDVPDDVLGKGIAGGYQPQCLSFKLATSRPLSFISSLLAFGSLSVIGAFDKWWASLISLLLFASFAWLGAYLNPDVPTYKK